MCTLCVSIEYMYSIDGNDRSQSGGQKKCEHSAIWILIREIKWKVALKHDNLAPTSNFLI